MKIPYTECLTICKEKINILLTNPSPPNVCTVLSILSSLAVRCGEFNELIDIFLECFKYPNIQVRNFAYSTFTELTDIISNSIELRFDELCKITIQVLFQLLYENPYEREQYSLVISYSFISILNFGNNNSEELISNEFELIISYLKNGTINEQIAFLQILVLIIKQRNPITIQRLPFTFNCISTFLTTAPNEQLRSSACNCISSLIPIYPNESEAFVPIIFKLFDTETEEEITQQLYICLGIISMTYKDKYKDLILSKINIIIQQLQNVQIQDYALRTIACLINSYQLLELIPYFNEAIKVIFEKHSYQSISYLLHSLELVLPIINEIKQFETFQIIVDCLKVYFDNDQDLEIINVCIDIIVLIYGYIFIDPIYFANVSLRTINNILQTHDENDRSALDSCSELLRSIMLNVEIPEMTEIVKKVIEISMPLLDSQIDYLKSFAFLLLAETLKKWGDILQPENIEYLIKKSIESIEIDEASVANEATFIMKTIVSIQPMIVMNYKDLSWNAVMKRLSLNQNKTRIEKYLNDNLISAAVSLERELNTFPIEQFISFVLKVPDIDTDIYEFDNIFGFIFSVFDNMPNEIKSEYANLTIKFVAMPLNKYQDEGIISNITLVNCLHVVNQILNDKNDKIAFVTSILGPDQSLIDTFVSTYKFLNCLSDS